MQISIPQNVHMSPEMSATLAYILADIPAMIWGAPGTGKSEFCRELSSMIGLAHFDLRLLLRETVDMRGLPAADLANKKTVWLPPSDMPFVGNAGPDNVLLVCEEINTASDSMQAAAFGLIHERRIGEHVLKPGVRIVATGNRVGDKAAARRMPSALANRFAHVFFEPDYKAWLSWAARSGIARVVHDFIAFRPELLHIMPGAETNPAATVQIKIAPDAVAFPTNRAWHAVSKFLAHCPAGNFGAAFVGVGGIVGRDIAAEFIRFFEDYGRYPSISAILAAPGSADLPDTAGAQYAVVSALARAATVQNFAAVMTYAKRLPAEMQALLIADAKARDSALESTHAMTQWRLANQTMFTAA